MSQGEGKLARRRKPVVRHAVPRGGGALGVIFAVVAVVALAVVPVVMGRQVADAQRAAADILQPARLEATRLASVQAQHMALLQGFLLSGDRSFLDPFRDTHRLEQEAYADLEDLVQGLDQEVRGHLALIFSISQRWHVRHDNVFDTEETREAVLASLDAEQGDFDEIQRASAELQNAIDSEVEAGLARIADLQSLQIRITFALLLLGLGATLAMAAVGWGLRTLAVEAQTRRHDAVLARREHEALLRATSDGVLGIDLEGRCLSLNRAGAELLGYSERELQGKDVHWTLHHSRSDGEEYAKEECPIASALAAGGEAHSSDDAVLWRKDGTPLPVQWFLRPLVDGLEVRGGVLTFTDMTQIHEKEEALRRAVRIREEVVSVVSHDLRNPLGVVRGAAELLLDLPLEESERQKQARIIHRSAQRMGGLIEDLLDVSRIEAGALVVRSTAEDAGQILEEVREIFALQAEEAGVSVLVEVGASTPRILADRDRVLQALTNLMENALKFTPYGGRVILSARPADGGRVGLSVSDTGPGVALGSMEHLFDRFWQASRHDRTGSGLGLAIVWGIAEAHGGTVDVVSRPGQGAAFRLILPAAPEGVGAEGNGQAAEA